MKSSTTADGLDWAAMLRNAKVVDLQAVRQMKEAHRALFRVEGPPEIGAFVRMFRLTSLFGFFAMEQKRFPVLNRAWADLQWILKHPEADEFSLASWLFFDLPMTEDGRTLVEVFGAEIAPENDDMRAFVEVARKSRYGIYTDAGGTRSSQRLLELVARRRATVTRGVDSDPGELFFTRVIESGGMKFMLGDTRGWPASHLESVTDMVIGRVSDSAWLTPESSPVEAYEKFMKLAGPYWFSMLYSQTDDDPVLEPVHYLSYSQGPVPDFAPHGVQAGATART